TLSPDTVNQGQRVFPEKSTPNGAIENKFELVFKLETAATDSVTLYYKFFDPDNFIGLGNNDNNASSWTGGDNYATSSITTGSITIAAGATNKALTVVVYSDGYTGTKLTASATTIIIDTAHAGDNFIVVVDTDQAKTNVAALGTTEATRYKETHNYAQTELLTVWRTLWMELDQMAAPTVTATDGFALTDQGTTWDYTAPVNEPMNFDVLAQPVKPNITLLTAAMLTACIEVKEVSQDPENWIWIVDENDNLSNGGWRTETPFVHNLPNANVSTVTNIGSLSRDININTHEFWTIQAIGGYEAEIMKDYDAPNELSVFGYRAPRYANINPIGGVIMIFQETIRDFAVTGISANSTSCLRTSNQINQLVTLHETLHTFGFVDHNPNNPNINDGDIMNASTWLYSVDTDHVVKLNAEQIKKIQANTMIQ
ncbi:MAG: hypothetical protein LBP59_02930, partial [Planctomycetaceae bacterium]|nr:hypothetical protein [Planctomycetaceae bacterium]